MGFSSGGKMRKRQAGAKCTSGALQRRAPSALDVDAREEREADDEVHTDREYAEPVVAFEHPGHPAVRQRAKDRRSLHCEPPEPEEFSEPAGRREVSDDRASG